MNFVRPLNIHNENGLKMSGFSKKTKEFIVGHQFSKPYRHRDKTHSDALNRFFGEKLPQ